jgi:hypothetical protein
MTRKTYELLQNPETYFGFLKTGYEPFHLTGDMGVLNEVEEYVALRQQSK